MKALFLQSSGRVGGNTARVVRMAESALQAEAKRAGISIDTEVLDLGSVDIRPCRGCRSCFDKGENTCPQNDELLSVKEKMRAADILVLAAPVYVNDVNGIMKNWIDRLAHVCHRPEFAGKTAMLLATTGATPARHTLRTMQVALWTWGYRIACKAWFTTGANMSAEELQERHARRIAQVARRLLKDIRNHGAEKPSFLSLVVFRIQQAGWRKAARGSIDYSYWNDRGWLDFRRCTWFLPHRASPLNVAAARLVGSVAAAIFT
ncbi:MAG: flavodoxin family protein [Spirochaetia bacterium]